MKRQASKKKYGKVFSVFCLVLFLVSVQAWSFDADIASAEISDSEIEAFVAVQGQIIQIQQTYNTQIAEATDEGQRQQIIEAANQEMIAAIQGEGLSIELYNQILTEAQANPEVMQQIERATQETLH